MGIIREEMDTMVLWFIRRWLNIFVNFWYKPIFDLLDTNDRGFLTTYDLACAARVGITLFDEDVVNLQVDVLGDDEEERTDEQSIVLAKKWIKALDEDRDEMVTFQEFTKPFTEIKQQEMARTIPGEMAEEFDKDPLNLEDKLIESLDELEKRVENEVREVLEVMNGRLNVVRDHLEKAHALLKTRGPDDVTLAELLDVMRPTDLLERETSQGTKIWRTSEEAIVAEAEKLAVMHVLDNEYYEAIAILTKALTGQDVPPDLPVPPEKEIPTEGIFLIF